ncbi:unnamed protein product [Lactuca virosa]|uniref:DNA/RNA-binding protein Alba-like domain-containing protein n=1 Tax=Lactuca virosa TaxID=75947 RepID=A0AAU9MTB8_9ASTR|nr:unnamed protein product [Lactuca virosa]
MDKYKKVEQKRPVIASNANEIRITSQGLLSNYISIATTLLQERRRNEITLKGMGQAISKTVTIAEIVKRCIPQLHQETEISSVFITDVWEPIEEGLLVVEMTRHVSMISITLSIKELDKTSPGYQAPILVERKALYNNYQRPQQPNRYNSVVEGSYGGTGKYQENRDPGEGGGRGRRGGGYGNYPGGQYRNYHNRNYQGGGYGRGGGGRYGGRGR